MMTDVEKKLHFVCHKVLRIRLLASMGIRSSRKEEVPIPVETRQAFLSL